MSRPDNAQYTIQKRTILTETKNLKNMNEANEISKSIRAQLKDLTAKLNTEKKLAEESVKSNAILEEMKKLQRDLDRVKLENKKLTDNRELVEDLVKKEVKKAKENVNKHNQNTNNRNKNNNNKNHNNNNNNNNRGMLDNNRKQKNFNEGKQKHQQNKRNNNHNNNNNNNFNEDKQKCQQNHVRAEQTNLSKVKHDKKYQDLLALQSNIYINGTSYHYELKLVPNNISLPLDNGEDGKSRNVTLKNDSNEKQFKDDLKNRFITKNYLVNYQKNETGKIIQKIANDFIKNTEQMHNYKTFYSRMPLHRYSRVAYGNRDEKIMLRTMDLEESNEIQEKLNTDYLARQTIADYD
ncbi:hypothetical protein SNEBB_000227 [Seison nebaliae]|nr:hypothetical protein SNEBB_000227 [Seison nebaliae]